MPYQAKPNYCTQKETLMKEIEKIRHSIRGTFDNRGDEMDKVLPEISERECRMEVKSGQEQSNMQSETLLEPLNQKFESEASNHTSTMTLKNSQNVDQSQVSCLTIRILEDKLANTKRKSANMDKTKQKLEQGNRHELDGLQKEIGKHI